ncbi:YybH family protein [Ferrimonas pelagia]|uniref:Nuclear transport factor 2 family protein n=1 Tax=Ferrimonas pelagia TaxID=1177826 RepID=A0ABP9FCN3_9GAMM
MLKWAKMTCLLSLFCAAANANPTVEREVQSILDKYTASVKTLDMTLAQSIWSQSQAVSMITPRAHQSGWEAVSGGFYQGAMASFSDRTLVLRDIAIHPLGADSAWAEFDWRFTATTSTGKQIVHDGRESQLLHKEADGWKIVHVHYSRLPE